MKRAPMCSRCRAHRAENGRKRCQSCYEVTNAEWQKTKARRLAALPKEQCDHCERMFPKQGNRTWYCSTTCRLAMEALAREYVPFDEWQERTRTRVLRTVLRRGWLTAEEIGDIAGFENGNDDLFSRWRLMQMRQFKAFGKSRRRNSLGKAIERLTAAGLLEKRERPGMPPEYRLSPNAPRSEVYYVPSEEAA